MLALVVLLGGRMMTACREPTDRISNIENLHFGLFICYNPFTSLGGLHCSLIFQLGSSSTTEFPIQPGHRRGTFF